MSKFCGKCGSSNHVSEVCPFDGSMKKAAVHIWKPIVVEDLDIHPILIESKRQYKEELKKRNLECRGLM